MRAVNIEWDVDPEDIYETLDNMTVFQAAEKLELPLSIYANMTTEERHSYAYEVCESRAKVNEIIGLPDEVDVPVPEEYTEDDITDWLSDTYGWCVRRYNIE